MTYSVPSEEGNEPLHERRGLIATGLEEEEDVLLALRLEQLRRAAPPARRQGLVVRPAPRPREVLLRHADEHPLAREVPKARRRGGQGIQPRVVRAVRPLGAHEAPHLPHHLHRLRRLPVDGLPPAEPRVEQNRTLDPCLRRRRARARLSFGRGHHQDVVNDVPAGAVAGQEEAAVVGVLRQPGIAVTRDRPLERAEGVLVAGRQRVLGREAVVHGDDEQASPRGQGVEEGLVRRRRRRLGDEAASVEVDEHGELLAVVGPGGCVREVEANVEAEEGSVHYDFGARIHGENGWGRGSWGAVVADELIVQRFFWLRYTELGSGPDGIRNGKEAGDAHGQKVSVSSSFFPAFLEEHRNFHPQLLTLALCKKKIPHHIKLGIHALSTKCRRN
uniref:Uncharacterized protein n=1 Tax=Setaria viridis TaxID=4556 RepID=A0A4U6VUH9_SETVI|nr:hypothetical protein SEVIR_2G242700v2 [Setaria viridis]